MSRKKADDRRFNPEKYQMNLCHECHGLDKTLNKENSKEVCEVCGGGVPLRSDIESSLLEKGGDEVLVEFPENARAMALKGPKISLEPFLLSSIFHLQNRKEVRICL